MKESHGRRIYVKSIKTVETTETAKVTTAKPYDNLYPGIYLENGYEHDVDNRQPLHRLIYEEAHGEIPHGHDIHHINGKKRDNSLDNLIALPSGYHMSLHRRHPMHKLPNRDAIVDDLREWQKLFARFQEVKAELAKLRDALGFEQPKKREKGNSRCYPRGKKRKGGSY